MNHISTGWIIFWSAGSCAGIASWLALMIFGRKQPCSVPFTGSGPWYPSCDGQWKESYQ